MTHIQLPYGKTNLTATIPADRHVDHIVPSNVAGANDPIQIVNRALNNPEGEKKLSEFSQIETVAIAVNDKTRPVPHAQLLPPLLERLEQMGVQDQNIMFVIATGTHPPMPSEEFSWILPDEIIERYPIICHDAEDKDSLHYLGETERDTPIWVNKYYYQADLHLAVGNIEPHQFMGFSGGVKSVAIGVAGKQTINHNHSMMTDENAKLGQYHHNPARQDVEEIGRMMRVDFVVNALLNGNKQIVDVIAGNPVDVMTRAIPKVKQIFQVDVPHLYDLVIVSPGGYPKDINVYQAQKGLAHATLITKLGGTIVLIAECPERTGSKSYEHWITHHDMNSHDAVFSRFAEEGFRVGPHKAFQLSRDASKVSVLLLSSMKPEFVKQLLLNPIDDLQSALDHTLSKLSPSAKIAVMPVANATIPNLIVK